MATISASWTKAATHPQLQRSSHNVSTIGNTVYVFGGELKPREPRDNDVHKVVLGEKSGNTISGAFTNILTTTD
jgi:N-acetylneuraminic acid mutarotase